MAASAVLDNINIHSHNIFNVECDFKVSEKCRKKYQMEYRHYIKTLNNNGGKLPCIFCSRTVKFSGRDNPNTRYKNINDDYFSIIDSKEKAYLLGWIASDGHVGKRGFKISIHQKDIKILDLVQSMIDKLIPIRKFITASSNMCSIEINSQNISKDICKLLEINPGKKSHVVKFPKIEDRFCNHFLRGYFDGDGCITTAYKGKSLRASISSSSNEMLKSIKTIFPKGSYLKESRSITWERQAAINVLDALYLDSDELRLERKYILYLKWKTNDKRK